jgi:hypothetical protein
MFRNSFLLVPTLCFTLSLISYCEAETVGSCPGVMSEQLADCDSMNQCADTSNCQVNPEILPIPGLARYVKYTSSILVGACNNGYWDDQCINCTNMVCASGAAYTNMDEFGECSGYSGTYYKRCYNCCIG